jgi:anti-sigma regulatory factor (Ser/Thr protein kinase)
VTVVDRHPAARSFVHEALLYSGDDEFTERTSAFIRDGLARDESVLTVVDAPKIRRLRAALGADADRVLFADMADVGRNPALIIQAWRDFVAREDTPGRARRGIGEPISAQRSETALVECHIHEALLNVAFDGVADFWLMCPYDTASLPSPVIERAVQNHPFVCDGAGRTPGHDHEIEHAAGFSLPLPPAPDSASLFAFDVRRLAALRRFVRDQATDFGLELGRRAELVVAASEIATNSVLHGEGGGEVRIWTDNGHLVCEIRGSGHITDPLVGRLRPDPGAIHGYGIWLANQFCDLVQIRSREDSGTTVRLHVRNI